jgi:hypothetical protein
MAQKLSLTAFADPGPSYPDDDEQPRDDEEGDVEREKQREPHDPRDPDDASDIAMFLTQSDINRLSSITGRNLLTREDLISQVTFLSCVSVEGTSIPLEPGLLSRLKSRCYKQEFPTFLRDVILRELHAFCGW